MNAVSRNNLSFKIKEFAAYQRINENNRQKVIRTAQYTNANIMTRVYKQFEVEIFTIEISDFKLIHESVFFANDVQLFCTFELSHRLS